MLFRADKAQVAVSVMLDVAFHGTRPVSAADIAERIGLARRGMEPLLQSLSRAGLLESVRGANGGYRLGRPPRDIRVADVVALVAAEETGPQEGPGGKLQEMVLEPMWAELQEAIRARLAGITFDDLMKKAASVGLRRPTAEPISFAI